MRPGIQRSLFILPTLLVSWGCGGDPEGTARWVGKTFLLDIPPLNWSEPRGIGGDIGAFVPQFLIGVADGSAGNLTVTLGTATAGVQDPCTPTTQVTANGAAYPDIQLLAPEFPMRIVDTAASIVVNTTIHDLTLTNVLPGDSSAKEGGLSATADIAQLYPLFTKIPNATKESVCSQLAGFGAPCAVCAFNAQPYCLTIKAVELVAIPASTPVKPAAAGNIPGSCTP